MELINFLFKARLLETHFLSQFLFVFIDRVFYMRKVTLYIFSVFFYISIFYISISIVWAAICMLEIPFQQFLILIQTELFNSIL